jgi:hypothetical protein
MCVVRQAHGRVERVIAMSANTAEYDTELRRLAIRDCLAHSEMRMSNLLMRMSLFEAMLYVYHRDFRPDGLSEAPPIAYRAIHSGVLSESVATIVALNDFADCVVRAAPTASHDLLAAPPGTARETTIIAQLTPHLPACVPDGATIALSLSIIRGAIAEVLYRYATLPSVATATTNPSGTHD